MKNPVIHTLPATVIATLMALTGPVLAATGSDTIKNTTDTAGLPPYSTILQHPDVLPAVDVPMKAPEGPVSNDNLAFSYDERPKLRTMTGNRAQTGIEFITLPHINFYHDGFKLSQEAKDILDGAAQFVYENDSTIKRIVINGYASDIAGANYNYRLSDRRAYAVWDYLAGMGVPQELMMVHGWGETRPIDENWTRNGRERNRHVEIQIVKLANQ